MPKANAAIFNIHDAGFLNIQAGKVTAEWFDPEFRSTRMATTTTLAVGRDYHVALVYDGTKLALFVDGKQEAIANVPQNRLHDSSVFMQLGRSAVGEWLSGILDEFRISKVARYDKDYTPKPRFTLDEDTLALYHMDEGQGVVLVDSSPNRYHGNIVGPKWVRASSP